MTCGSMCRSWCRSLRYARCGAALRRRPCVWVQDALCKEARDCGVTCTASAMNHTMTSRRWRSARRSCVSACAASAREMVPAPKSPLFRCQNPQQQFVRRWAVIRGSRSCDCTHRAAPCCEVCGASGRGLMRDSRSSEQARLHQLRAGTRGRRRATQKQQNHHVTWRVHGLCRRVCRVPMHWSVALGVPRARRHFGDARFVIIAPAETLHNKPARSERRLKTWVGRDASIRSRQGVATSVVDCRICSVPFRGRPGGGHQSKPKHTSCSTGCGVHLVSPTAVATDAWAASSERGCFSRSLASPPVALQSGCQ